MAQGQATTGDPGPVVNSTKTSTATQTPATDVEKEDTKRHRDCKAVEATCTGCGKKGHYEKVCLKGKCSTHSLEVPQANSAGAGASEPLYFSDEGQPVYTYMVSVPTMNKHLIKFPVALEPTTLKGNNTRFSSICVAQGRHRGRCQSHEQKNIQSTIWRSQRSAKTDTYQDGKLWKYCSESVRNVPCFFQVERQGLQTIILCDRL